MSTVAQWGLSGQTQTFKQTSDRVPHHFSRIMFMAIPKFIVIPIIRFHDLAVQLTESANCFYQVYLFSFEFFNIFSKGTRCYGFSTWNGPGFSFVRMTIDPFITQILYTQVPITQHSNFQRLQTLNKWVLALASLSEKVTSVIVCSSGTKEVIELKPDTSLSILSVQASTCAQTWTASSSSRIAASCPHHSKTKLNHTTLRNTASQQSGTSKL